MLNLEIAHSFVGCAVTQRWCLMLGIGMTSRTWWGFLSLGLQNQQLNWSILIPLFIHFPTRGEHWNCPPRLRWFSQEVVLILLLHTQKQQALSHAKTSWEVLPNSINNSGFFFLYWFAQMLMFDAGCLVKSYKKKNIAAVIQNKNKAWRQSNVRYATGFALLHMEHCKNYINQDSNPELLYL